MKYIITIWFVFIGRSKKKLEGLIFRLSLVVYLSQLIESVSNFNRLLILLKLSTLIIADANLRPIFLI